MVKPMKSFKEQVLQVVRKIKPGKVMTYKEVAHSAGNSKAARAVGSIMANNTDLTVPCHRVVKSDGTLGSYNGLRGKSKKDLLMQEGVELSQEKKS